MIIARTVPLILGSGSPRRRQILGELGILHRVQPAETAEEIWPHETPTDYVKRVVREKLEAVAARVGGDPFAGVLVADTVVVLDGQVLGKPRDVSEAAQLVGRLVGRTHTVLTRYAISTAEGPTTPVRVRTVSSAVTMRAASAREVAAYAQTGEGLDKAGAYAVQGLGSFLIERIEGSYSNVIGLPACEVVLDLCGAGLLERFP